TWTSFFEIEPAQGRRSTGEKSFTNRQRAIDLVDRSIAVTIARIEQVCETKRHVPRQHRVPQRLDFVVVAIRRLKTVIRNVSAKLAQRERIIQVEKTSARRINLIVTTHLTWPTRLQVVIVTASSQQSALASLARVSYKRNAKLTQSYLVVRLENRPDNQTLEIEQTHIFITETSEDDRARPPVQHTLSFKRRGETIDRRLVHLVAENVDRVSVFIDSLHDTHRSAVDRRTEEACDRRVALILNRRRQRRKLGFVVPGETRIEIFETHKLLTTAGAKPHRPMTQPVHEIHVADLKQTKRACVCRKATAIIHDVRLLLFNVDNYVSTPVARR